MEKSLGGCTGGKPACSAGFGANVHPDGELFAGAAEGDHWHYPRSAQGGPDDFARCGDGATGPHLTQNPADPIAGNPAGDVTLVEFYDVRCPYCRHMLPAIESLLSSDKGVRLIYKDIPILGPGSVLGSRALLAAQRQGGYAKMQSAVMTGPADVTEDSLKAAAGASGLDWGRLRHDMDDPAIQAQIDSNLALAKAISVEGTPAFVLGERLIPGSMDLAGLQAVVKAARAR